jgi:hypothetical protein
MSITFENDNDVIVYGLERNIAFARSKGYILAAQCVWLLASIIRLEQGLMIHIDNLRSRETELVPGLEGAPYPAKPNRIHQVPEERVVSATPWDRSEDQRANQVLEQAERFIKESTQAPNSWQYNRIHPLPQTKRQLKKVRKIKRLQEAGRKKAAERTRRLQEIRPQVIHNLSKE